MDENDDSENGNTVQRKGPESDEQLGLSCEIGRGNTILPKQPENDQKEDPHVEQLFNRKRQQLT